MKPDMSSCWVFCWLSLAFLCALIHDVSCTLKELSTTSLSDPIVLYEGVLTYDNTDRPNDRVLVFPFVDGCDKAFCEQFNAYVLTTDRRTTILYNSCVCKCKDGVLFDVMSTRCLNSISNNAISEINNVSSTMDNLLLNTSAFYGNVSYDDSVTDSEDDGLEFHIWMICMCASFVLCILFVYSAFEKRKQKRKQGKEQHSTLQSKYYAHEVAGVRKTLMECYNMPRIKARPEDEPKCDSEFPERSRLSSDEDYMDSLSGSRESFLHPKWESRAPSIKVTIVESTLERLNENDEEEISDHESFGKWTPAYTQQIQSKRKAPSSRKSSPSDTTQKTSALGKRFNNVGRRICTSSAFLNLYRQKRSGAAESATGDSKITAIASSIDGQATTSTDPAASSSSPISIDTVVNFNCQSEETGVVEHDVVLNV